MKRIYNRSIVHALFCLIVFASCKKNIGSINTSLPVGSTETIAGIQPYPFSWETADFIPVPPGYNAPAVPWGGGVNRRFSDDILTDYHSNDGWVMVYNLFNTSTFPVPGYFMLYNKYRGLIRIYFYLQDYTPVPSNYITYTLSLGGSSPVSSMLNFAGNDIADVSSNLQAVSQAHPYQLVSTGAWYSAQFELAYDPNIVNKSYSDVDMVWEINSTNITQVNLDGSINGTLQGTIGSPASSPNIGGLLVQGALYATGAAIFSNNPHLLPSQIQAAAQTAITSGLSGVIKNVFSAIFGGNSGNSQEVHLNFNAEITLNGNMTNNSQILANSVYIPGTSGNQTAPGYSPGYNEALGVFNISNRPTIKRTVTHTVVNNSDGTFQRFRNSYVVDDNSFSFIFNPAVINNSPTGAQIQNIEKKVVIIDPEEVNAPDTRTINGTNEQIGVHNAYSAVNLVSTYTVGGHFNPVNTVVVRVSFDVVPNNGAPTSKIVKTFTANLVTL